MTDFLWKNYFKRTTEEKEIGATLKENILFADLSSKQLKFVTNIVHLRKYRTGEIVFRQGEVGVGMYIIASGHVNITKEEAHSDKSKPENGIIITKLISGDFFGELSLVEENGRRSAMAIAGEDTSLIGFFKPDLLEILERKPGVGVKIALRLGEVIGRRLKETTDRVSVLEEQLKLFQSKNSI
ncbi:MAG: cyclic nucleotide-binding domain-containing protein [Deltaproteobacteria bacterium]|nr:cyclic nucleotide-binding domain-containing protein [Deltaproteobacteria bacterium]